MLEAVWREEKIGELMNKIIYLFALTILVSGCATTAKYDTKLNTWVGAGEDSLVASWGVPDKEYHMND